MTSRPAGALRGLALCAALAATACSAADPVAEADHYMDLSDDPWPPRRPS
ncbi:hypothetical protein HFP72_02060 [Nocardiopsis sp. ARC36]